MFKIVKSSGGDFSDPGYYTSYPLEDLALDFESLGLENPTTELEAETNPLGIIFWDSPEHQKMLAEQKEQQLRQQREAALSLKFVPIWDVNQKRREALFAGPTNESEITHEFRMPKVIFNR